MRIPDPDPRFEVVDIPVQETLRKMGNVLGEAIEGTGYGFTLLLFKFGPGGGMFYISNAERESMIEAMKEFIAKNEKKEVSDAKP